MFNKNSLLFFICLLSISGFASSKIQADTIDNWQIYLGDSLVLSDNTTRQTTFGTLELKMSRSNLVNKKYLTINYNKCSGKQTNTEIGIETSNRRITQYYFSGHEKIKIKTTQIIEIIKDYEAEGLTLTFYNSEIISKPIGGKRGQELIKLRVY
jgi:hypothetical protein